MVMINAMGLIMSDKEIHINSLTDKRSISALPFAAKYRLIDFILSSMVNSGITNVGVVPRQNYSSLMDHLGSGKEWDLSRKNDGLHILPPLMGRGIHGLGKGDVDLIAAVGGFIKRSKQKYIILSDGNMVLNIDFKDVIDFHMENYADITLVYYEESNADRNLFFHTILEIDNDNRVTGLEVRPRRPKTKSVYMNILLMEKSFLQYLTDEAFARGESDLVKDILIKKLSQLNICAYRFNGYVGCIDSIDSYYRHSMNMLNVEMREELFNPNRPIYTKIKDQVPTKYGNNAYVENCLIADGCTIEGQIENSIVFRGVYIGKGTRVKNCIIMQNSVIQDGCDLEHVIMDKEVIVRESGRLIGEYNYPMIIAKGAVV
jgi:glucose-1-phosphate adenylyltransferase